jgi:hypothetical protein
MRITGCVMTRPSAASDGHCSRVSVVQSVNFTPRGCHVSPRRCGPAKVRDATTRRTKYRRSSAPLRVHDLAEPPDVIRRQVADGNKITYLPAVRSRAKNADKPAPKGRLAATHIIGVMARPTAASGGAGNRTRVLRRFDGHSPGAVCCASTRPHRSRTRVGVTGPVAVSCPVLPRDRPGRLSHLADASIRAGDEPGLTDPLSLIRQRERSQRDYYRRLFLCASLFNEVSNAVLGPLLHISTSEVETIHPLVGTATDLTYQSCHARPATGSRFASALGWTKTGTPPGYGGRS